VSTVAKIAVEDSLSQVKDELSNRGFQVVTMDSSNAAECDCCVVSGQDSNVMGIAETITKAPVINAQGLSANEIVDQVQQRVNK
jgi:hypothetical protein